MMTTAIRFPEVSSGFDLNRDNAGRLIRLDHIADDNNALIEEFTYNDAGYPAKAEVYNRGSDVVVETLEFIYKKTN